MKLLNQQLLRSLSLALFCSLMGFNIGMRVQLEQQTKILDEIEKALDAAKKRDHLIYPREGEQIEGFQFHDVEQDTVRDAISLSGKFPEGLQLDTFIVKGYGNNRKRNVLGAR